MNLDWNVIWQFRYNLLSGTLLTIALTFITMAIAIPGGILLALMRLSSSRILSSLSRCYVELFRNLPIILVVYWAFYVMPLLLGARFSAFSTGLIALCLNVSAYNAETFRAGVNSIRSGQTNAGLALGLSRWQVIWKIILPQAARRVFPVIASTWVSLFKDTSVVSVIGVGELAHTALEIRSQTFRILEVLTTMAVIYWLLGYPQAKIADWIKRKFEVIE